MKKLLVFHSYYSARDENFIQEFPIEGRRCLKQTLCASQSWMSWTVHLVPGFAGSGLSKTHGLHPQSPAASVVYQRRVCGR